MGHCLRKKSQKIQVHRPVKQVSAAADRPEQCDKLVTDDGHQF